jgi:Uri superfamily endonuclease
MKNYFGKNVSASKDVERHCDNEKSLRKTIDYLEANNDGSRIMKMEIESYRHFLKQLLQSKSEVASRLFK